MNHFTASACAGHFPDFLHHAPAMCSGRLGPFILAQLNPPAGGGIYLLGAALALYAASRLAAVALAGHDPQRAGWRAVGHFLPVAAVALASVLLGRPALAVGVAIGTSVASLSLALGTVVYLAPPSRLPATRRVWLFVLPAALLALLAGFSAQLTWLHAALLAALGLSVLGLWREQAESIEALMESAAVADPAPDRPAPHVSPVHLLLAVALAVVGGWVAARGAQRVSDTSRLLSPGLLAAAVLSPLLVLPALGTGAELAQRDQTGSMAGTLVALALLNVCGLLPAIALAGYVVPGARQYWFPAPTSVASEVESSPTSLPSTSPTTTTVPTTTTTTTTAPAATAPAATRPTFRRVVRPAAPPTLWGTIREQAGPTRYPLPVWRVDTVILIVLGLTLVPFALGRLTLGRLEGMALLLGYAAYLAATAVMAKKLL